jgi:hypothetical protein
MYFVKHSYKWHLIKQIENNQYVLLSDSEKSILNDLCIKLNSTYDYSEKDAIRDYYKATSHVSLFDLSGKLHQTEQWKCLSLMTMHQKN